MAGMQFNLVYSERGDSGIKCNNLLSSAVSAVGLGLTSAVVAEEQRAPFSTFKDCDICPEMIVVPPGRFWMGDLHGDGMYWEKPVHDVRIDYSFAVGKYEVTFREHRYSHPAVGSACCCQKGS